MSSLGTRIVETVFGWRSYHCNVCGSKNESPHCAQCHRERLEREREERQREIEKEQAQMRAAQEEAQRAYMLKLKQLDQEAANDKMRHEKDLQQQQLDNIKNGISACENDIKEFEDKISLTSEKVSDYESKSALIEGDIQVLKQGISQFAARMQQKLLVKRKEIKLDDYEQEVISCNKKIQSGIDRTCVSEQNIGKFLKLAQYLRDSSLNNQACVDRLSSIMTTFGKIIESEADGGITIAKYFKSKNMSKFIKLLANEDLESMEDITCDTEDDFKELNELILNQLESEKEKWQNMTDDEKKESNQLDEPKTVLNFKEKKFFKTVCLKPETWKKFAIEKEELLKEKLIVTVPIYCLFFERINEAMSQAQSMLEYNEDLNAKQLKAIECGNNNNNNNNNNEVVSASSCIVANNENKDNGESKEIENKEETFLSLVGGMDMDSKSKQKVENGIVLREMAIKSINIVDSLGNELNSVGDFGITTKSVMKSFEDTCMKTIVAQSNIGQSLLLAQEILKLKPPLLSDAAKELWSAVDKGIINIFNTALLLNKNSADYYGYFYKFSHSFGYFLSAQNKSLTVSTEKIQETIDDFIQFSIKFEKQIASLSDSAMSCIESCVKQTIGAAEFEQARKNSEMANRNWLDAQKQYNNYNETLNSEKLLLFENESKKQSEKRIIDSKLASLKDQLKHQMQMKEQAIQTKNKLLQLYPSSNASNASIATDDVNDDGDGNDNES